MSHDKQHSSGNDVQDLKDVAARAVERALRAGADSAEVFVRRGVENEFEVRDGAIERLTQGGPQGVGLRLWRGDRSASTSATTLDTDTIDRLIADTLELADISDPIPEQALADRDDLATDIPELDLYDETLAQMSAESKLDLLKRCESAAMNHDPRITISSGASWGDAIMSSALATSNGFCEGTRQTYAGYSAQVIADDADKRKRNGFWFSSRRFAEALAAPEEVGRIAGERTVRQLGSRPIPTCELPVVFDPMAGSALIGLLFSVLRGDAIERGASYLADQMHEQIASDLVTIIDDPTIPRGIASRPFDGEGLPATRTTFVADGRLMTWALNTMNARKLKLAPTGHASRPGSGAPGESASNLYLAAGTSRAADVIAGTERGFYCESMMGFGFNPATGDFSRGATGRLIENGKLTDPVSEITLSANFRELLARIDFVCDDLAHERAVNAPTFRVEGMTVGGS